MRYAGLVDGRRRYFKEFIFLDGLNCLFVVTVAVALMIMGGGKWSIDKSIADGMK